MNALLARLRRVFHRDDDPPVRYEPKRDPAVRWLRAKRYESRQSEQRLIKRISPVERDVYPARRGRT